MAYYRGQHNKITSDWALDTKKIGGAVPRGFMIDRNTNGQAIVISPLAMTKSITEVSILRAMTAATESLGRITDEAAWTKIAQLHSSIAVLDDRSIALITRQNPALTGEELSRLLRTIPIRGSGSFRPTFTPRSIIAE